MTCPKSKLWVISHSHFIFSFNSAWSKRLKLPTSHLKRGSISTWGTLKSWHEMVWVKSYSTPSHLFTCPMLWPTTRIRKYIHYLHLCLEVKFTPSWPTMGTIKVNFEFNYGYFKIKSRILFIVNYINHHPCKNSFLFKYFFP